MLTLVAGVRTSWSVASGPTFLTWNSCPGSASASTAVDLDCQGASGAVWTLVGAFMVSTPIPRAVSLDADVEVEFPMQAEVPEFWNFELAGCNPSGLTRVKNMPVGCESLMNAFCGGDSTLCDIFYSSSIQPSNRLHLSLSVGTFSPSGMPIPASPQRMFAFALNLPIVAAGNCGGCQAVAVVTWKNGTIYGFDEQGSPLPPIIVSSSDPTAFACASVNDDGAACMRTPARRTTWGQLKSLYR